MSIPKQLINLLGIVVLIAVLVGGIALGALPFFGNAQDSASSTRTVEQTNTVYEVQLTQLQADAARIDEIDASVVQLRSQIAAAPYIDDVQKIVIAAAEESGASVVSVMASESVAWAPRTWVGENAPAGDTAPAPAPAPADDSSTDASTDESAETPAEPSVTAPDDEPAAQQQIPIVIEVQVGDGAQATDFLEKLGRGPRLIGIQTTSLTGPADGAKTLTVNALAFIRADF